MIQAAYQPQGKTGTGTGEDETPAWFTHPPSVAIQIAGKAYLRSILDKNQIALFRLMIRDAHRFHKLASRYQREVLKSRNMKFVRYFGAVEEKRTVAPREPGACRKCFW